ncbi:hypothetical protein DFH08DRAFT_826803 [Mycena albidolilacea]|uniref:Uncharacterized protein n=1 Tax=Mycena albidolilacea TaxID=1033008 RepID=A0AAD7E8L8_9AGAR|nr:hypothetical protein DFH08DRAFT_826803 [Mycena albidolilacea]
MSYNLRDPEQRAIAMDRFAAGIKPTMRPAQQSGDVVDMRPRQFTGYTLKALVPQSLRTGNQPVMHARKGLISWPSSVKSQTPQPPALSPSSPPPPSSIPQVFIKYTPYNNTDRQKIREKLYRAALLEPVAAQIVEVGATKRSRERAEVGPAPHGFEYVQVGESVFLTAIEGNGSMMSGPLIASLWFFHIDVLFSASQF